MVERVRMLLRELGLSLLAAATVLTSLSCSGGDITGPTTATLKITTTTNGADLDPDGYTLNLDAGAPQPIGVNASASLPNLAAGSHSVRLSGLAQNCTVQGDNPRSVTLAGGASADMTFAITCSATTGSIQVTTVTTGSSLDPDGYSVTLDGRGAWPLGVNTSGTFSGLRSGGHTVGLGDVAANCVVQGDNPRDVVVTAGASTVVSFLVTCATPLLTGTVRVTTVTTGPNQDSDGYVTTLDGSGPGVPVPTHGSAGFNTVPVGTHTVALGGLAINCTVSGDASKQITVSAGATGEVAFSVTCGIATRIAAIAGDAQSGRVGSPLPQPLVVRVVDALFLPVPGITVHWTLTGGGSVSPTSVQTGTDGEAATLRTLGTTPGTETTLATVAGLAPATFTQTAIVGIGNGIGIVSGDGQTGQVGTSLSAPLVVRVTDVFGNPVPGFTVNWTVTGGGSVSEATTQTGENGETSVIRTLGTTVGLQATTATAEGLAGSPVTFTHTATAGSASSITKVSGDGQSGLAGAELPDPLVIQVLDADGKPVVGRAVTWVIGVGGGSVAPQTSNTDNEGKANTHWTLGAAGPNTVTAVVSGVGTAAFTATAGSRPS